MSYSKMRVEIPDNPKELLNLANLVFTKHLADGDTSPLKALAANSWTVEGPKINLCMKKHEEAEMYRTKMEAAYKERELLIEGISNAVRASRDVLTGVNHDNMKRLAEWGFNVVESAKVINKKADTKG